MEDDKKKTKEYYQVNLDTGRIFWIVFVLGIIVIGIFFLGIFLGRDEDQQKFFSFDRSKFLGRGAELEITKEEEIEESPLLKLIEEDLEEESRYIEIEDLGAPAEVTETEAERLSEVSPVVTEKKREEVVVKKAPQAPKKTYIARGDFYIQVASFIKEENAESLAQDLEKRLYKVVIEKSNVEEKTFYRVRVGPFETEGVATNTMIAMKRRYNLKDPFVVKKRS